MNKDVLDSLQNIQKIYHYASTPEYTRLLYTIFNKQISEGYKKGNRVIIIEFASTKRLVQWIENGDCSCDVKLYCSPVEEGTKYIENIYPNTAKSVKERSDVIAIVITCNLIIMTQCFCATAIIHDSIDVNMYKSKYPKQFDLKCIEINDEGDNKNNEKVSI